MRLVGGTGPLGQLTVEVLAQDLAARRCRAQAEQEPAKLEPGAGAAVRVTELEKEAEQAEAQLIPEGLLMTVPEPVPLIVTVRVCAVVGPVGRLPNPTNLARADVEALRRTPHRGACSYLTAWLFRSVGGALLNRMELNGACSNPRVQLELPRLGGLKEGLVRTAATLPRQLRPALPRPSPVLETVTVVLERAGRPMRAREIHAAAEQLLGRSLRWPSVRGILSAYTIGGDRRFRRVTRGTYELSSARQATRLGPTR
jgi:hypothetical protein